MVIVFDLDDTLYPDLTYVWSGFYVVACYLSPILQLSVEQIERELKEELIQKRKEVFDRFLQKKNYYSKKLVKQCLSIYRKHLPTIRLFPEAIACLDRFRHRPLYIVTDGNKLVQKRKFLALGLASKVKKCLCTYAYGLQHSKPSPYCFQKICEWENVSANQVIYIADNPYKDFVGIKPLGFHTIRLLQGPYRDIRLPHDFEAEKKILSLDELTEELLLQMIYREKD